MQNISREQLKQIVDKIERLEEEKTGVLEAIKEIYQEAKSNGFDVKALRQVVKLRKIDRDTLQEQDTLIEMYREILNV